MKGELANLSRTFNKMADTILRNIEDLKYYQDKLYKALKTDLENKSWSVSVIQFRKRWAKLRVF